MFGILRVDDHAGDGLRFLQAHVRRTSSAVGGLVDAGAERRALAVVRLAGADVDDVGVRRRQTAMSPIEATGCSSKIGVQRGAVVLGLPDAAGRVADVDRRRIALVDRDVVDAAAHDAGPIDRQTNALQQRIVGLVDARRQRPPAAAPAARAACPPPHQIAQRRPGTAQRRSAVPPLERLFWNRSISSSYDARASATAEANPTQSNASDTAPEFEIEVWPSSAFRSPPSARCASGRRLEVAGTP